MSSGGAANSVAGNAASGNASSSARSTVGLRRGTVSCNHASGANSNLAVDGFDGITVLDNTLGATGGSPRCKGPPVSYVVHPPHVLNSTLQPGYTERELDGCIP